MTDGSNRFAIGKKFLRKFYCFFILAQCIRIHHAAW